LRERERESEREREREIERDRESERERERDRENCVRHRQCYGISILANPLYGNVVPLKVHHAFPLYKFKLKYKE
jgi:hypothetical protein